MAKSWPTAEATQAVPQAFLTAVSSGRPVFDVLSDLQQWYRPGLFFPAEPLFEVARRAMDIAGVDSDGPVRYRGLREEFLPEVEFRGRVAHRNSQYTLVAVASLRGGLELDLDADAGWWVEPLWIYATYAAVIYLRVAAARTGGSLADVCEGVGRLLGLQPGDTGSTVPATDEFGAPRQGGQFLPSEDVQRVRNWCAAKVPGAVRNQVRITCESYDRHLEIVELRAVQHGRPASEEWVRTPVAKVRYTKSRGLWSLSWRGSDERWHNYNQMAPGSVQRVLDELDRDPTALFWG